MQELFEAVRAACSASAWSRGVDLARQNAVSAEPAAGGPGDDEVVVRVSLRGGLVSQRVALHPDDEEWECDCASRDEACEHVAAAVIALRRARERGRPLDGGAGAPGRLGYRLAREGGGLSLERVVVAGGREEPLRSTLAAVASGRVEGPAFVATPADVEAERALGSRLRGRLGRDALPRVLDALARCEDVTLDGERIAISTERTSLRGVVEKVPGGFRLRVEPDPRVREVLDDRVAVCSDALRIVGETKLTGRELEELPRGRFYPDDRVTELATEAVPDLRARIPVALPDEGLPRAEVMAPRVVVETRRDGDHLSVLPLLVYGDPPCARVDAGRLVHLRGAVPLRDEPGERRAARALQTRLGLVPGRRVELADGDAVDFAERLRAWREAGGHLRGEAHRDFVRVPGLVAQVVSGRADDPLAFDVVFTPGQPEDGAPARRPGARVEAERVLRAWREGDALVPLAGGGFAPLPAEWLARHGERVADLLAARDARGRLARGALPDLARLCDALGQERPADPALARIAALADGFEGIPALADGDLPRDLAASLRAYQREGVRWLHFLRDADLGGLLADDMGLGKTLQALCAVRGRTLVVAPTSVVPNWLDEIARFRPALRAHLYHGPRRALDPGADVTVTSYALLRQDAERLGAEAWDCVVLDEAQAIKNPESQVARAAYALDAGWRLTLTGTPVENRLDELWSQMHFLNPGLLGTRRDFDERVVRAVTAGDAAAVARLRERIRPFVLRRLKDDVAPELPPRTERVLRCELEADERAVYDAVRAATRQQVVARLRSGGSVLEALEALLRLRQAACHAGLVPGQHVDRSSKLALLLEELDEAVAEGHKALVFSQWTSLLDRVEPLLRDAGIAYTRLDGATRDRAGVVAGFQSDEGPPVLLISLRAGGTGLNLTAADHVFLLDPWWNPAVEDQAADRAHRIGQTRPVFVHRLVAQDTVEERILALQEQKRALAEAALGEAQARGAGALTRDDLLALLD